uniref:Uncharacterized protein n=1 Tax=Lotus japonicus TaxID=34305 RepID=I3T858_LOTJA|nr:unknown [Lotus japonicus]
MHLFHFQWIYCRSHIHPGPLLRNPLYTLFLTNLKLAQEDK